MSYVALYRKFRPAEFSEVKGQEHIVTTLQNQIKANRIGHAYLFCGTRGTGKTSIAKIFAKAVNCESPVDGSPCGECQTCKSIAAGTAKNVVAYNYADICEIQVSYVIGKSEPISVYIDTKGTNKVDMEEVYKYVNDNFDFSVQNIIDELELLKPNYYDLACYGHFGRKNLTWEKIKNTN